MATFENANTQWAGFFPINAVLRNVPAGASTMAVLMRSPTTVNNDVLGLLNASNPYSPDIGTTDWYHTCGPGSGANNIFDDDGIVSANANVGALSTASWYILITSWPGGVALERMHAFNQSTPGSWTHANSAGNNGGNRTITSGQGHVKIGYYADSAQDTYIALCAIWQGVQLSDAQVAELSVNNKTSDWYNNSAGHPDFLVETNTLSMVDIGANPSTFWGLSGTPPTLTGPDPPGWTFDGQGSSADTPTYIGRRLGIRGVG